MLYSLFVFIRKSENPLWIFFWLAKTGNNVALSQKPSNVKPTFGKWGVPIQVLSVREKEHETGETWSAKFPLVQSRLVESSSLLFQGFTD